MTPPLRPALMTLLPALPAAAQERLTIMGWTAAGPLELPRRLRDPERALRRALGGPHAVSLVDLELDPERWHGRFLSTTGPLTWQKGPRRAASLGRLWVDPALTALASPVGKPIASGARVRILGILLADPQVRSSHQDAHKEPGGYGQDGLFIAQLIAVGMQPELPPK